jgi:ATP-dependent Clp protease protease subunit
MAKKTKGEILISDAIGGTFYGYDVGVTAKGLKRELAALDGADVDVLINSPGGSVFEATTMYALLDNYSGFVHVKIVGLAASSASFLALAGDRVSMAKNALFMIHDPWGFAMGDAGEMRKYADLLDKVKETILNTYEGKSKLSRDELAKKMADETWFTADEARAAGFVDAIGGEQQVESKFDLATFNFKHPPANWPTAIKTPRLDAARAKLALVG